MRPVDGDAPQLLFIVHVSDVPIQDSVPDQMIVFRFAFPASGLRNIFQREGFFIEDTFFGRTTYQKFKASRPDEGIAKSCCDSGQDIRRSA